MEPVLKIRKLSSVSAEWIENRKTMNWGVTKEFEVYVKSIVQDVRKQGDAALVKYTKEFDGVRLDAEDFKVPSEEIKASYDVVNEEQISALEFMKKNVETIEKRLLDQLFLVIENKGIKVQRLPRPLQSVGCYVPGGTAAYPSTLIMTCVPAKVAGVPRVVVCTPPTANGRTNPLTLVAADICDVNEIYRIGGPQAISALAYGTQSIDPVRKIVGPGNKYVAMAKTLVSCNVPIDIPAGPSEIVILADESADPQIIALDLISQAEHGINSVSGLVTTSEKLAKRVVANLKATTSSSPKRKIVKDALSTHGFIFVCTGINEMIKFANDFAPEHLEIIMKRSEDVARRITSSGLVLIGQYSPVSASDYCVGTNHVLPTGGFGHVYSGLSVHEFVKSINFVECSREGLLRLKDSVKVLAEAEKLPNHFLAVKGRFKLGEAN